MTGLLDIGYFVATLSFAGGLKYMSSPAKATSGNIIAAAGMILAVALTLGVGAINAFPPLNIAIILMAVGTGSIIGKWMSDKVEMTGMPQLVSFFNATGGGCAMLLGLAEAQQVGVDSTPLNNQLLLASGLSVGALSFSGSILAYLKLAGKLKDRSGWLLTAFSRTTIAMIVGSLVVFGLDIISIDFKWMVYVLAMLALVYGILFVLPIGGADMPVVISLLNALTGIATALAGLAYSNKIMIAGGIFVGAAGVLLTVLMCKAMNRSLFKVLAGNLARSKSSSQSDTLEIQETTISESAMQLAFAGKVAIVPGYGMAVAQAQHACEQLHKLLEERGTEVHYVIHPVAGRMPGHMNVLLAEANIDYAHLKEMDEVNDQMAQYDFVLVVGANDVVNPVAEKDPGSPVYGMPIIRAYESKKVVVIKRGMNKGYAGIPNLLFGEENCSLLFGDAKQVLEEIVKQIKII